MFQPSQALMESTLFHGEICGNRAEMASGLRALDVRQRINGVTKPGIAALVLHYHLQSRRIQSVARADLLAEAARAIAIQAHLMSVRNFVAVGQSMAERRYGNGAERSPGDHFAAVESADAKQFHVMEAGASGSTGPGTHRGLLRHQV